MNLKAMFRQLPSTAYLYAVLAVGAISAVSYFVHVQREIGARNAELRISRQVETSLAKGIKIARKAREAAEAKSARDSIAQLASRRAVRIAAARSDSAVHEAAAERARALALVADSSATLAQMREEVVSLVSKTAAADAAHAAERAQWVKDSTTANSRIKTLGEALAASKQETASANEMITNLHNQIKLVERKQPGVVQRYIIPTVSFGVGVWAGSR